MAPKKAPKPSADGEVEDVSCTKLMQYYRNQCKLYQVDVNKQIKKEYDEQWDAEQIPIKKFHVWDEVGWQGIRALMEAAMQAKYKHCTSIRLWRTKCEDEGVRLIMMYLCQSKQVVCLELLDAAITHIGCEIIAQALNYKNEIGLLVLKLDHNPIGSAGLAHLAKGIGQNKQLQSVSLTYCGIDEEAAESLFEICIYQSSGLIELNVSGNPIKDAGVCKLLEGLACSKSLEKISVGDCQFNDSKEVLEHLQFCMIANKKLSKYNLKHNNITDDGVDFICDEILPQTPHIFEIDLSEWIQEETLQKLNDRLSANKPKKGKKGKKKK